MEEGTTTINGGDYLRLNGAVDNHNNSPLQHSNDNHQTRVSSSSIRLYVKIIFVSIIFSVPAVLIIKRFGPVIMQKEVIPIIHWLTNTFSPLVLAVILFAAIALLPVLFLPTLPFKWVAGMTFGYGLGFLLILAGVSVAVSLPYFIGYHLFFHKIKRWLDEHPREAAIVRLAGEGDWLHQFRGILLIRLAPFPYVVFNYTAVITGVKYSPYLAGSLLGMWDSNTEVSRSNGRAYSPFETPDNFRWCRFLYNCSGNHYHWFLCEKEVKTAATRGATAALGLDAFGASRWLAEGAVLA